MWSWRLHLQASYLKNDGRFPIIYNSQDWNIILNINML